MPLIIAGIALLMALLERFPILVWAGAALLGWVAGEIIVKDARRGELDRPGHGRRCICGVRRLGAVFVVGLGCVHAQDAAQEPLDAPLVVDLARTRTNSRTDQASVRSVREQGPAGQNA